MVLKGTTAKISPLQKNVNIFVKFLEKERFAKFYVVFGVFLRS